MFWLRSAMISTFSACAAPPVDPLPEPSHPVSLPASTLNLLRTTLLICPEVQSSTENQVNRTILCLVSFYRSASAESALWKNRKVYNSSRSNSVKCAVAEEKNKCPRRLRQMTLNKTLLYRVLCSKFPGWMDERWILALHVWNIWKNTIINVTTWGRASDRQEGGV